MKRLASACLAAATLALPPAQAQALEPAESITAYHMANRCFAVIDAMSRTQLPSDARRRLDQMLFWGVAAKSFADEAQLSQAVQRQDLEAAASRADAEVARSDPGPERDLLECDEAFRLAMRD
jgi:hypothetical protein